MLANLWQSFVNICFDQIMLYLKFIQCSMSIVLKKLGKKPISH